MPDIQKGGFEKVAEAFCAGFRLDYRQSPLRLDNTCLQPRRRPIPPTALELLLRANSDVPNLTVTCAVPTAPNGRAGARALGYVT